MPCLPKAGEPNERKFRLVRTSPPYVLKPHVYQVVRKGSKYLGEVVLRIGSFSSLVAVRTLEEKERKLPQGAIPTGLWKHPVLSFKRTSLRRLRKGEYDERKLSYLWKNLEPDPNIKLWLREV